jgi:hypothetical protein
MARHLLLLAIAGMAISVPATAQQFPEPVLYQLLPTDYPYPLARVCYTSEGICALPTFIPPGRPCECRRADGEWVKGVCTH